MSDFVEIFEVGPRDGLQNEARIIPAADKIALVDALSGAGFRRIECASFVNPKWVPQMATSAEVMAGITRAPGVAYVALTPNMRGLTDALAAKADEVAVFGSASEGFSKANINATIAESLERFAPVVAEAVARGVPVRGYVSCVVDCPYDGPVAPEAVARVAKALLDMGCAEIGLGDTLGRGSPERIGAMIDAVKDVVPVERIAGHFHDTGGQALAAMEVALGQGVRIFDAAVGGLGGCPYAPGAAGNVATEAVLDRLTALGFETGLDRDAVMHAARMARAMRGTGDAVRDA
ncbi:hydroxymethylglutaryl-CoA lyase [Pseudaestuariivita atlantica]|uniref:Hydroxymethylglutaryl-CoA lyase n=1 Tax=Pseudaestuariivita atlantica TaxID=1317121 RepID=A0A0L1JQG8_9RHOB|nr:hydroxymethylglutaryl-CoA lyase [Pseudaestuariivita atlantica]KNG93952.1 hydroxymethylglutaryl-CoA lyase [Pseudaestuariivita atlantica]